MDYKKLAKRIREAKPYYDAYEGGALEHRIQDAVGEVYEDIARIIEEIIEEK